MKLAHPALPRWLAVSCIACAALLASALAPAAVLGAKPDAIRIEVDGVDRAMADNAYRYLMAHHAAELTAYNYDSAR